MQDEKRCDLGVVVFSGIHFFPRVASAAEVQNCFDIRKLLLVLGAHEDADKEEKAAWVFVRDGAAGGWREEALLLPDGWPPP